MSMSGVRFEVKLCPVSICMVCQVYQAWSMYLQRLLQQLDSISVPISCSVYHFYTHERVDIPSLTWKPRTMDKSKTYTGHGKDLSWTLDNFGLLVLGCGHCLGTTMGQFKTLPHRAYFFNVKFHKWWSNNEQMQCTQSCTLSFETILNISDKDLHS